MDAITLFWVLVVILIIGGIIFSLSLTSRGSKTSSAEKIEGTDFIPSQMFMGKDNLGGLAVNEHTHQICLFTNPSAPPRLFPITDLIGSHLIKNGEVLGEGKRSYPEEILTFLNEIQGQTEDLIKRFHIESSQGPTQRIDLVVLVHDQDNPIHTVNFIDMETKEGGILFEKAISAAKHWQNVLEGLILQADQLARFQSEISQEQEMAKAAP
ncbi:MAG: hypothetical protein JSU60_05820 [Nitrospirota bacterium]|nr:MAG: hypothetical protein JSU60_05820 [Nitrospirota bacterium]